MIFFRTSPPRAEQKLIQAQRDLRDVQQQLDELDPASIPFGSQAARRFAQLTKQQENLTSTISHLQEQLAPHPVAA